MKLKISFLKYCELKQFEINSSQLEIIEHLDKYYTKNFNQFFIFKLFKKEKSKFGFYLVGDVGVGKTMILNFFFNELKEKKLRFHFNEFMIEFHDFIFKNKNKENGIDNFVKNLSKKARIIYFDEFQVTNIVDAMILGKLFKKIFKNKIKVIFSSNIDIPDLYKDGLQREQFIPFIKILQKNCFVRELLTNEDYRKSKNIDIKRFLSPINKSNNFISHTLFRTITKNKKKTKKILKVKGRIVELDNFYEGFVKFDFDELCDRNLGSEDYINVANTCDFIFIENLPEFDENKSNQQQRFITLVDIIYEKRIPLMITSKLSLDSFKSSKYLAEPFKRTISRLYELTSSDLPVGIVSPL